MIVDASTTAVIAVDMWDKHYCKTYTRWGNELACKLNRALPRFRKARIPILFMSGDIYSNYSHTVGAMLLSHFGKDYNRPKISISPLRPKLPDWYTGCACIGEKCEYTPATKKYWTMLNPFLHRSPFDLIGDWSMHLGFLEKIGVKTLLYCGGAANICVLETRGFSIRQSMAYGYKTILMTDLVIPFLPDMSKEDAMKIIVPYYKKHICPALPSSELEIQGEGNWPNMVLA